MGLEPASVHIVESLMYSRDFCLLIRVYIYQNVHLDKYISKMVVAIFFNKLKVKVKGQRSINQNDRVHV